MCFFIFILLLIEISYANSADSDLRRLIWVYAVCQGPKNGTLGKYGLIMSTAILYMDLLGDSMKRRCLEIFSAEIPNYFGY